MSRLSGQIKNEIGVPARVPFLAKRVIKAQDDNSHIQLICERRRVINSEYL